MSNSESDDFGQDYLSLNGVPTEIITFGPNIFELSKLELLPETLILIIPGNPGVIKYYEEFMRCIFNSLNASYPVWGISHAGHTKEPITNQISKSPIISGRINMSNLDGQIKHKKFFINDFIPESVRLILVGHSIGAYMALELLQHLPNYVISKAILLFPTIERMAISPNGKWSTPFLTYCPIALPTFITYLSTYLPKEFRLKIIQWYFKDFKDTHSSFHEATLSLLEPSIFRSFLSLAKDEMDTVVDINSTIIVENQDKLILYYGRTDKWCPVSYYQDMRNRFPGVDARLCEKGIEHAFVLSSSREMAKQVSDWLK